MSGNATIYTLNGILTVSVHRDHNTGHQWLRLSVERICCN